MNVDGFVLMQAPLGQPCPPAPNTCWSQEPSTQVHGTLAGPGVPVPAPGSPRPSHASQLPACRCPWRPRPAALPRDRGLWGPGGVEVTARVSHCWNWVAGEGLGPGLDHEAMEGMPYKQAAYLQKASI